MHSDPHELISLWIVMLIDGAATAIGTMLIL